MITLVDMNGKTWIIAAVKNDLDSITEVLLQYNENDKSLVVKSTKWEQTLLYVVAANELHGGNFKLLYSVGAKYTKYTR